MMQDYFDFINSLPIENRQHIEGYSLDEIRIIEQVYDIKIDGELKEFLLFSGRCDGFLYFGVFHYHGYSIRNHLLYQDRCRSLLFEGGPLFKKDKVFFIDDDGAGIQNWFIKTNSDDKTIYMCGDYGTEPRIEATNRKSLSEDLISRCKLRLKNQDPEKRVIYRGDLLRFPEPYKKKISHRQIETSMMHRYFDIIHSLPMKNRAHTTGYSSDEIDIIEQLYDIEIEGELREFFLFSGRCDGLLSGESILMYKNSSFREYFFLQNDSRIELRKINHLFFNEKSFIIGKIDNNYYCIKTTSNDQAVYAWDVETNTIQLSHQCLSDYLIERCTHELKNINAPHFSICKGDLLKLP